MKKISDLYKNINMDIDVKGIKNDYREVEEGDIFVCTKEFDIDGHDHIEEAIKNGAKIIIVSKDIPKPNALVIKVPNTNLEFPYLCQKFYDYPDKSMKIIGVIGNDGKSTTSSIISTLIGTNECGFISSTERSCSGFSKMNEENVFNSQILYSNIKEFKNYESKYLTLEIADKDIMNNTYKAIKFDVLAVTNITYEQSLNSTEENLRKKIELIKQIKDDGTCILNKDDKYFEFFKKQCNCKVLTYGRDTDNDLQIVEFNTHLENTNIKCKYNNEIIEINSPLLGEFNVYNLACSILTTLALGLRLDVIMPRINTLKTPGKLELLNTKTPYYVMIDNAHTKNSINKLLEFINTLDTNRVIVVIGKKGGEDQINRSLIGKLLVEKTSYTIFTTDSSKEEQPIDIINNIIKEIKDTSSNYEIELDRRKAIEKAINLAEEKDIILILGRGNEEYLENGKDKIYFNDIEEAYNAVIKRNMKDR